MRVISTYYKKAKKYIHTHGIERALTAFVDGIDHGCDKCAFGLAYTVINHGSYTITEDEAISILNSHYDGIKRLAEAGDDEAMVMVAESIRYGFDDDSDEPYFYWLERASELGNVDSQRFLSELDALYTPFSTLPPPSDERALEVYDETMRLADELVPRWEEQGEESVLIAAPDLLVLEDLGIIDAARARKRYGGKLDDYI